MKQFEKIKKVAAKAQGKGNSDELTIKANIKKIKSNVRNILSMVYDVEKTTKDKRLLSELYKIRGNYEKGYHNIQLNRDELLTAGVFYYTLQAKNYTTTKRMIVID